MLPVKMQDFWDSVREGNYDEVSSMLHESESDLANTSRPLEWVNEDQWTGLDVACHEGHYNIAELFLQKKEKTTDLTFPLLLALGRKHFKIFHLLLNHHDPNIVLSSVTSSEEDPVLAALTMQNKSLVQLLQDLLLVEDFSFHISEATGMMTPQQIQRCFLWTLDQNLGILRSALLKADIEAIAAASCSSHYVSTNVLHCHKHILCAVLKQFLSRHRKQEDMKETRKKNKLAKSITKTSPKAKPPAADQEVYRGEIDQETLQDSYSNAIVKMIKILGSKIKFKPSDEEGGNSLLHLAMKFGRPDVVTALLELETDFHLMSRNDAGITPIEVTDDDNLIGLVIRDKRFLSPHNVSSEMGKTILRHLCSMSSVDGNLFAKVESLFICEIDPDEFFDAFKAADAAEHDYIIWWLLKVKPSSFNLENLSRFFDALLSGHQNDKEMKKWKESFLHVFARTGFDRAINYAMKKFDSKSTVHKQICSDLLDLYVQENGKKSLPCMEAAKHNQCQSLLLLLQPMLTMSLDMSDVEAKRTLHKFVHHEDKEKHTLLYLVSCHKRNLFLAHSIVLQLECACHDGKSRDIQKCLQEKLGSNNMSKNALQTVQSRYPGPCKRTLKFIVLVILLLLIPLGVFLGDIATDAFLLRDYHREMRNDTVLQQQEAAARRCQDNVTMDCFMTVPAAGTKFWISISIMALPFLFYVVEVVAFQTREDKEVKEEDNKMETKFYKYVEYKQSLVVSVEKTWYLYSLLCPLVYLVVWLTWPLRVFIFNTFHSIRVEASDSHRKIDYYSKSHRTFQVLSSRAHVIEVSTESSLQPLLQLYLFLPSLISLLRSVEKLPDFRLIDLTSTRAIQLYSVILSVLSVAYSFTAHYRRKKVNAVKMVGTLIYFSFTLCFILSRLLAFQTFAYFFGPANFAVPAMSVLCHVILMAVLHGFFEWDSFYRRRSCCVTGLGIIYNCVLNGLANIFVLNRIDVFHDRIVNSDEEVTGAITCQHGTWMFCTNSHCSRRFGCGENQSRRQSTIWRHILFDLIVAAENAVMVLFGFSAEVYKNDLGYQKACDIGVFIVLVLFVSGLTLKVLYYAACHMWSDLICQCCRCDEKKGDVEAIEMEELPMRSSLKETCSNNNGEGVPLMSMSPNADVRMSEYRDEDEAEDYNKI